MDTLDEIREQWEGSNPKIIAEKEQRTNGQVTSHLVVTRDERQHDRYCCYRYFILGFGEDAQWQVSMDGAACDHETVMKWLCNPKAATCRSEKRNAG